MKSNVNKKTGNSQIIVDWHFLKRMYGVCAQCYHAHDKVTDVTAGDASSYHKTIG